MRYIQLRWIWSTEVSHSLSAQNARNSMWTPGPRGKHCHENWLTILTFGPLDLFWFSFWISWRCQIHVFCLTHRPNNASFSITKRLVAPPFLAPVSYWVAHRPRLGLTWSVTWSPASFTKSVSPIIDTKSWLWQRTNGPGLATGCGTRYFVHKTNRFMSKEVCFFFFFFSESLIASKEPVLREMSVKNAPTWINILALK